MHATILYDKQNTEVLTNKLLPSLFLYMNMYIYIYIRYGMHRYNIAHISLQEMTCTQLQGIQAAGSPPQCSPSGASSPAENLLHSFSETFLPQRHALPRASVIWCLNKAVYKGLPDLTQYHPIWDMSDW